MSSFDEMEKMLKAVFDDTDVQVIAYDENGPREITSPKPSHPEQLAPKSLRERFPDWLLRHKPSADSVLIGDVLTRVDGKEVTLTGGCPPHKPESTGRIYVENTAGADSWESEYFPSVYDLEWVHKSDYEVGS